jgi:two-component system chemotaxis sensor kinase CheA
MKPASRSVFTEEAQELLASLEDFLLELEQVPDDLELVRKVFSDLRASGRPEGDDIPVIVDKAWIVYDKVKNGEIRVIRKLIDLVLEARDSLRTIIADQNAEAPALRTALMELKTFAMEEGMPQPPSHNAGSRRTRGKTRRASR